MKTIIYTVLTSLLLLGSSCAKDEISTYENSSITTHDVALRIDVEIDPSSSTRTPRPLMSSDSWQKIDDLRIYVFYSSDGENEPYTLYYPIVKRTDGTTETVECFNIADFANTEVRDDEEIHVYHVNPKLKDGYYRFLAIGRDDNPDSDNNRLNIGWKEGETEWDKAIIKNSSGMPSVHEVFVGYNENPLDKEPTSIHVNGAGGFVTRLSLKRFVAGVLLNVKNIPEKWLSDFSWKASEAENAATVIYKNDNLSIDEVAIISAGYDNEMPLTRHDFGRQFIQTSDRFHKSVLTSVFTNEQTNKDNGVYIGKIQDGDEEVSHYLKGNFVFPTLLKGYTFSDQTEWSLTDAEGNPVYSTFADASLYLCLFHKEGESYYPLKLLPVKIVRTQANASDGYSLDDTLIEDNGKKFNIIGNHIYCLGQYNEKEGINEPIDLGDALKHPDLEITVIGAWQADVDIEM